MKQIYWQASSLEDLRALPRDILQEVGFQLDSLQHGYEPSNWQLMSHVGPGVKAIRVNTGDISYYWVLYIDKFPRSLAKQWLNSRNLVKLEGSVYVLHVFTNDIDEAPTAALDIARQRLADLFEQCTE